MYQMPSMFSAQEMEVRHVPDPQHVQCTGDGGEAWAISTYPHLRWGYLRTPFLSKILGIFVNNKRKFYKNFLGRPFFNLRRFAPKESWVVVLYI